MSRAVTPEAVPLSSVRHDGDRQWPCNLDAAATSVFAGVANQHLFPIRSLRRDELGSSFAE